MALTFDSLTEDGGRQRAMSLRLPAGDVNSFGGWFPSVSLNALRRLSSTTRSEQLSTSLDKPRKRSRISLAPHLHVVAKYPTRLVLSLNLLVTTSIRFLRVPLRQAGIHSTSLTSAVLKIIAFQADLFKCAFKSSISIL
ncbi:hypothetical protein T4E_1158 [Trichinella pseudospiralis]|uniref:Uncharacterized protein n=1 Tax=Trichinella pseudospiralis TaxID=6337 RepID=A0A0V0YD07_TRIPS|nr:hypothetical protein T4E_1158 [Trichinella pseudospiralis]